VQFAEGYEYGSLTVSYDYEPIYALGSMLGIGSPDDILRLIEKVERYGLDAISTGVVLAWATEAFETKVITERETLGLRLNWGNVDSYAKAIENMLAMSNKFYRLLGRGVETVAEVYGGLDFAMALGRNEVAGYHCGPATIVGQLVGFRHSHLDNAGYTIDQRGIREPEKIVDELLKEEMWRCILTSLVVCLFARRIYTKEVVSKALQSIGIELDEKELEKLGEVIFREKYKLKFREGFSFEQLRVPRRFFETVSLMGRIKEDDVREMSRLYAERVNALLSKTE
jgi:aldehyde:ferredoxin oxidoreductase